MDGNLFPAGLSFVVGVLSGFQGVYDRYGRDSFATALTGPGFAYLLSRGIVPATIFWLSALYGLISSNFLLWALAIGAGSEVVLRSKILVRETRTPTGGIDELLKGPLDLLRWYQGLCLEYADESRARKRQKFVKSNLPDGDFLALCARVTQNAEAYTQKKSAILDKVNELKKEFEAETARAHDPAALNNKYREKLGYAAFNLVGANGFKTLFA